MARQLRSELMTVEEYQRLLDDPRCIDELSRGRLVREPRPNQAHGRIQLRIAALLDRFVTQRGLGYVVVESGFVLERNPDTLRGPDVAFVARGRYGDTLPAGHPEIAPDLVVEILSPSDRLAGMLEKIAQYFGAGTRMVWLINPDRRTATVYRAANDIQVLHEHDELSGEDVIPEFRCRLHELLDAPPP